MNRRTILSVGALAGSLALAGLSSPIAHLAGAQATDATPAAGSSATTATDATTAVDPRVDHQQAFIDAFAQNLGVTPDAVEQALRDTMKQMIDEAVTTGDISADDAATMKQAIDEADVLPMFGGHGPGDSGRRGRGDHGGMMPDGHGSDSHGSDGRGKDSGDDHEDGAMSPDSGDDSEGDESGESDESSEEGEMSPAESTPAQQG